MKDTIAEEKKRWEGLDLTDYQVEVGYGSVRKNYTVITTVKDNKLVNFEVRCDPGNEDFCQKLPTKPYFSPGDYTIPGIFDRLENFRRHFRKAGDTSWSDSLDITFDAQYHYPKVINFDILELSDDEYTIAVLDFKILDQ